MNDTASVMPLADAPSALATAADLSISIIVPVRNEGRHIESTLRQLMEQDYDSDKWEILVVDGDSTDDTAERVREISAMYPRVRLLLNPKRLSSAARNIGIRHARGEVVLIVDGHCEVENRSLLKNVSAAFERSGADCLGRPQSLNISNPTPMQKAIALARTSRLGHHPASFIYANRECFSPAHSVAIAYRREVFEKVGYFDERFDACEDVEFNHRIDRTKLKCFFSPSIQVRYFPRTNLTGLFRQIARYGRGRVRLFRKHHESFALGSFLPAMFWLGVFVGWTGGFLWPILWFVYFGILALYAGAILAESVLISITQKQLRLLYLLPVILLTIHLASAMGVFRELIVPSKRFQQAT
jgi:succinoglycan biosynthesis protein ExoA